MKAMILAAGRGMRMRPLTDTVPKPLLTIANKPLIEYHVEALVRAGIHTIVINTAYLGQQIRQYLGDGKRYGCDIIYSLEPVEQGLETAGGIVQALPLLCDGPFIVVNGDIFTDYDFSTLTLHSGKLAHLVCVANPQHNQAGDFTIVDGLIEAPDNGSDSVTFSGIALYDPRFFNELEPGRARLLPIIQQHILAQHITGEFYPDLWHDIGTVTRLQQVNQQFNTL